MASRLRALLVLAALTAPVAGAYAPQTNWRLQCMGCHHGDGSGEEGRVPSVRQTVVPFSRLPDGRAYMLRVPGVAQSPLSDADTAALLNWMARSLSDVPLPADFVDYTAEEVARWRHEPLAAVKSERERLLHAAGLSGGPAVAAGR